LRILHIHRNEPDSTIKKIIELQSGDNEVKTVELYEGEVDYDELLKLIFSYDRVISW
jgi:hypothetical protein